MAEQLAELNKDSSGFWEEVQITIVDTAHTSNTCTCYVNKTLKLAYVCGICYSGASGSGSPVNFSGLPLPATSSTAVRVPMTDTTNKAGVGYISNQTGDMTVVSGVNSYLNFCIMYPIK